MNLALSVPEPFLSHLKLIHEKIVSAGHECYLVGGSVRDLYRNQVPKEYDLTTSARPEVIKTLFKSVIETGIKHGTVTILLDQIPYEITTYRIDQEYSDGRHPDKVIFGTSLSEDLKRRDFTMNALAMNLETGEVIDEHQGKADIDKGIIRTIGNPIHRFSEDGLRPIRAIRFASVLGFQIEEQTRLAIKATNHITAKISVERLQDEITKSLKGKNPAIMVDLLLQEKILSLFLSDFKVPVDFVLDPASLRILDSFPKSNVGYMMGIWCHCLHPTCDTKQWETWLQKLKFSNAATKDAAFILQMIWTTRSFHEEGNDYEIRKRFLVPLKTHLHQRNASFPLVWEALATFSWSWLAKGLALWKEKPPLLLSDLQINGNYIQTHFPDLPKSSYGTLLSHLLDLVLQVPGNNVLSVLHKQSALFVSKM